jgi:hypothetical protein
VDRRGGWSGSSKVRSQNYTYAAAHAGEEGSGGWNVAAVKRYLLHRAHHGEGGKKDGGKGGALLGGASGGSGGALVGGPEAR